jgi:hypothetical protein
MAVIIELTLKHGNILEQLKERFEAERKQYKLIYEEMVESADSQGTSMSSKSSPLCLKP